MNKEIKSIDRFNLMNDHIIQLIESCLQFVNVMRIVMTYVWYLNAYTLSQLLKNFHLISHT
jgi:hypothetical protein